MTSSPTPSPPTTSSQVLQIDGAILLELLQSQHNKGLGLEQVWSEEDHGLLHAGAIMSVEGLGEGDDACACCLPPCPWTAGTWFAIIEENEQRIGPQEARRFKALHEQWRADGERHALCKRALALSRNQLFLRLLAFISDLVDYERSQGAQQRMDYVLPTATALFGSPLYFPEQPQEGTMLNSFVTPNGLTVLQTMASQYGDRAPRLEGVCTSHTLVPLLKRLFAISDSSFSGKEFKEFRAAFNKAASLKLQASTSCIPHHNNNSGRSGNKGNKQHHKNLKHAASNKKKQPQQKEEKKKKTSSKSRSGA